MSIHNERLNLVARQPLPPIPDTHAKNFTAAKDSAERSREDNGPNGAPQFRGPLEGGATLHVVGHDDAIKAKIDSAIDKAKSDLDSMSEMGEMESLRLQMAMDRRSKMMSTLSNVLQKMSDTEERITANLK